MILNLFSGHQLLFIYLLIAPNILLIFEFYHIQIFKKTFIAFLSITILLLSTIWNSYLAIWKNSPDCFPNATNEIFAFLVLKSTFSLLIETYLWKRKLNDPWWKFLFFSFWARFRFLFQHKDKHTTGSKQWKKKPKKTKKMHSSLKIFYHSFPVFTRINYLLTLFLYFHCSNKNMRNILHLFISQVPDVLLCTK